MESNYQCRWSPTLGALEGTHKEIWGTDNHTDDTRPTVFFGIYGLPDFYKLWRHIGTKYILWAGSDILHFQNGYWLEDGGGIKVDPKPLAEWINKHCKSYCENEVERQVLHDCGIEAEVIPSFLGKVSDYEIEFKPGKTRVYLSANPGRELEYGWGVIEEIADRCNADFYLYGVNDWKTKHPNVHVKGRVPKEVMNDEIKSMTCGLRLNEHMDGFSEITAKSILWGQYPLVWAKFQYPFLDSFSNLDELVQKINGLSEKTHYNPVREWYRNNLNKYPWNTKS